MNPEDTYVKLVQQDPITLDIEFSCANGEIFVIVGPSGSGKTTILRSIAGLHRPASGRITCQGIDWFDSATGVDLSVQQRATGLVFQDYALFPHLDARENIGLALAEKGRKHRKTRIDELLETVHLTGLGKRFPHQLSGGQQQRVAVARALARKPRIMLLDEPFSSVDQQTRKTLVRELVQLRNNLNIPVIHVTHDLNEARRIADRLCIINHGRGLQVDRPETVMASPANATTARLTGHDNVFSGKLERHDPDKKRSHIMWHGITLETPLDKSFDLNTRVDWFIPASRVVPLFGNMPEGEHRNVLPGRLLELIQLGEGSLMTVTLDGVPDPLQLSYSSQVIRERALKPGDKITVSLQPDAIHLMRPE